ncbi:helix-turn-helix transcriptional regulator [Planomicrobium sp. YIM 101495]|uniref:helix-turn-helix transcriptional regulator n=1 Tax=Planomicrobium sp. YIM 101495 TaxID=2665160 RepID=UPI0012B6FEC4|nr:helix-turn-helix transcriptional regulator [Planomicrobium sp. YIM 101495]MTD31870.1 helix-turn-helix domain-containing protein [Planomicrobium sp. YIM 101495]
MIENRVRELRAKYKLTQDELAKRTGVTRQTIVSLEKGSYTPSLLLAMNIAEVLGERIEEIFYKGEEKG